VVPAGFTLIDDIERWVGPKVSKVLIAEPSEDHGAAPIGTTHQPAG